ncbi:MAG: TonB-dependent receptor [Betaproteobacteria bacterium]
MITSTQPTTAFARKPSVIATGIALSLMAAQSGHAQQASPTTQATEKIEVTGTRIPPPNLEGASPVTVIDAQSIRVDGVRSVENLLNNLPQVIADQGGNVSNGSTGTATVNLRALGPTRTLVLVNGRRLPAGTPRAGNNSPAPDLNQIPAPLIKRVEVLTGGASAIYGSDAVAGVVNFIMNDKFEGVQFEVNQSFYNHQQNGGAVADMIRARAISNPTNFRIPDDNSSDGRIFDMSVLMGGNFANGKGNATVFFNYKKEDALLQSERDFSACSVGNATVATTNVINGISFGPGLRCGGSGTSFPGQFVVAVGARTVANAAGNTRAYVGANDQYNFGPLNYYQRPSERYGFNAFANYDVLPNAKLYSEFSFHDDHTIAQLAPSGLFGFDASAGGGNPVHFDNPFLSDDWKRDLGFTAASGPNDTADAFILRRNVEGGGRQDDIRHTSFRSVIGVKGDFATHWNYDLFAQTAKVIYQNTVRNDLSLTRVGLALDAVRDAAGNIVCRSGAVGCVPYNIWSLGGVTPAALAYLSTPGFQNGSTEQKIQGGNISVDLGNYGVKMPLAKNGAGFAIGVERHEEALRLETDTQFSSGDLPGFGTVIGQSGAYTVKEIYTEARLPLIEGQNLAHLLSVNGSFRHSDYNIGPKTNSYGLGVEWAPVASLRTRGSYQRAVRAANVAELFAPSAIGLFNLNADPCGPSRINTAAECARTGLPANLYGNAFLDSPAGQYNVIAGGNAGLAPESSDSYTLGMVFTPSKNFSATFDAFNIKVEKVILPPPPGTILAQCLATGSAAFCSLVQRDRLGTLWALPAGNVVATNQNLGKLKTSGVDVGATYNHKLEGYGGLTVDFLGTYTKEFVLEPIPGLGDYDCAGYHGGTCGAPQAKWRHKLRTTWATPWNVDVAMTWRFIGKVKQEGTSSSPLLQTAVLPFDDHLAQANYFDIAASWAITKRLMLRGGINNVLDKDPPLSGLVSAAFGNGNTYPQVYDALGRRIFINVTASF